jgi:hypothetical protein
MPRHDTPSFFPTAGRFFAARVLAQRQRRAFSVARHEHALGERGVCAAARGARQQVRLCYSHHEDASRPAADARARALQPQQPRGGGGAARVRAAGQGMHRGRRGGRADGVRRHADTSCLPGCRRRALRRGGGGGRGDVHVPGGGACAFAATRSAGAVGLASCAVRSQPTRRLTRACAASRRQRAQVNRLLDLIVNSLYSNKEARASGLPPARRATPRADGASALCRCSSAS